MFPFNIYTVATREELAVCPIVFPLLWKHLNNIPSSPTNHKNRIHLQMVGYKQIAGHSLVFREISTKEGDFL